MKFYHYIFITFKFTIFMSLIYVKLVNITKHKYDDTLNNIIHIPTSKEEVLLEDMFKVIVVLTMLYLFMPPLNNGFLRGITHPSKQRVITKYDRAIAFSGSMLLLGTMNSYKLFLKEIRLFLITNIPYMNTFI